MSSIIYHKCCFSICFATDTVSRVVSQFISGISRVFHKLLTYFNGTIIYTSTVPAFPGLFISLNLNLSDSGFVILFAYGSSLQCCYKIPNAFA